MDTVPAFLAVAIVVILAPGPDFALSLRNTLIGGRASGVATAFGVAAGQLIWAFAASLGLAALVDASEPVFRAVQLAGAGYLNVFLARSQAMGRLLAEGAVLAPGTANGRAEKVIVEHTNINPNKAAHIGHLRNAVLGDVLVATLRALGHTVEVQNYIDDTGVQVADVVVGCLDLRGLTVEQVAALPEPFDYWCWDLYSEVGRWYEEDPARQKLRRETLHQLERGEGRGLDQPAQQALDHGVRRGQSADCLDQPAAEADDERVRLRGPHGESHRSAAEPLHDDLRPRRSADRQSEPAGSSEHHGVRRGGPANRLDQWSQ